MSELLTVAQVAALLQVSPDTVMRRFARVTGVIDLGSKETPKKRRYRVLRIPRAVVEKWAITHGGRIAVDIPPPTTKRPKTKLDNPKPTPPTEDDLMRDLATVANQHGQDARRTLERIARRARAMTFVPENQWDDMVWVDEEDD